VILLEMQGKVLDCRGRQAAEPDPAAQPFPTKVIHMKLVPGQLSDSDLEQQFWRAQPVELDSSCWLGVEAARQTVLSVLENQTAVYGVNTGFGLLANRRISSENLDQLQLNLVRSHCAGVGEPLDDSVVRLVMILKATGLAQGYSGVRRVVIETILKALNLELLPYIPSKGSVGASGDLAPLAHLTLALIGEGEFRCGSEKLAAAKALAESGLEPLKLQAKEGLALLNGTQVSTALALAGLFRCRRLFGWAIVAGAMSVDAALGSDTPFDERIHKVRRQSGQIECARMYRDLLANSEIRESHRNCNRVQDPYSLRCQPQVMGACLDSMRHAAIVLLAEANSVSDNPLVFVEDNSILSGGNFHAEPVALVADQLAVAIAEIGSLSERRLALLIDQHLSQLPPFLVKDGGLNSGFMIPQVTAAALVSENKQLASPASVDSLPTSANQEDHVSMATYASLRLRTMCDNLANILAIELLAACQGIDFRQPLKTSVPLSKVHQRIRSLVPCVEADRPFHADIATVAQLIKSGEVSSGLVDVFQYH
jgi:histidine ammonia-lyase